MADKSIMKFDQPSPTLLIANQYLWVVLLVVILFTLFVGYFMVLQPAISRLDESKNDSNEVMAKQTEVKALVDKINALNSSYQGIQNQRITDLRKLQQIIPSEPEVAELFVIAERLAINRGFQLDSIDINNVEPIAVIEGEDNLKGLNSLLINMSVSREVSEDNPLAENSYTAFKEYLDDLERNLRLMDVETVSFSGVGIIDNEVFDSQGVEGEPPSGTLGFNFTLTTYFSSIGDSSFDIEETADTNQTNDI